MCPQILKFITQRIQPLAIDKSHSYWISTPKSMKLRLKDKKQTIKGSQKSSSMEIAGAMLALFYYENIIIPQHSNKVLLWQVRKLQNIKNLDESARKRSENMVPIAALCKKAKRLLPRLFTHPSENIGFSVYSDFIHTL